MINDFEDEELNNILHESFEQSTNFGREVVDNNQVGYYISKLIIHKRKKNEICCICMDEDINKLYYLPCCGEKTSICRECLTNTMTRTSVECPACRENLKNSLENYRPTLKSLKAGKKLVINRQYNEFKPPKNYNLCYKRFSNKGQNLVKIWIPNNKERHPLSFCDTNLSEQQQKIVFEFCKKYKNKYNNNQIINESQLWNKIKDKCSEFYKNNKNSPNINDNYFNDFINDLLELSN